MITAALDTTALIAQYEPLTFACAYGSAFLRQKSYDDAPTLMPDFIFAVDDVRSWHLEHQQTHALDYSGFARTFGVRTLGSTPVYYHPFVSFANTTIKYGLVSTANFLEDLTDWKSFYLAGRLQKPVHILKTTPEIEEACHTNRAHALNLALFFLPDSFSDVELYRLIASFSYRGDSRMGIAENNQKIRNMVDPNIASFDALYRPLLEADPFVTCRSSTFTQSPQRAKRVLSLPDTFLRRSRQRASRTEETDLDAVINTELSRLNFTASIAQTLQGFYSAGVVKSLRYVLEKRKKCAQ